jgi:hypothetical protein
MRKTAKATELHPSNALQPETDRFSMEGLMIADLDVIMITVLAQDNMRTLILWMSAIQTRAFCSHFRSVTVSLAQIRIE